MAPRCHGRGRGAQNESPGEAEPHAAHDFSNVGTGRALNSTSSGSDKEGKLLALRHDYLSNTRSSMTSTKAAVKRRPILYSVAKS